MIGAESAVRPPRLKRLKRLKKTERRAQILASAIRCFAHGGFRGTTTRGIAACCGVNEAILFRHFPTKEALYRAILDERLSLSGDAAYPDPARFATDAEFFSALVAGVVGRMERDPLFLRMLLYSALEEHGVARAFLGRRILPAIRHLTRHIRRRQRQGAFRDLPPEVAARALLGMAVHHALMTRLFKAPPRGVSGDRILSTWVSLFLDGISKGSRR